MAGMRDTRLFVLPAREDGRTTCGGEAGVYHPAIVGGSAGIKGLAGWDEVVDYLGAGALRKLFFGFSPSEKS